ncbi:hypothetical protein AX16_002029 [Volvariella volvacea WC 439]|nr:hypothetical protein AX16_002029 [Volvariella volvacea WC 439]
MASLEYLTSVIYHERQAPGSMLCAQHALNALLQGSYFSAPDLSEIARQLDIAERHVDTGRGRSSTNMDDTGYFSVQVLEQALRVWGLNLTRWRGEEMRPYHNHPHTQLAFILNLEEHWLTFRRFGDANTVLELDNGDGHWFNLNSFLPGPEWVGKLYLGMLLQEAENQGYSVFAVTQADPTAPLALPRTEADEIATATPEPSSTNRPSFSRGLAAPSSSKSFSRATDENDENYADAVEGVEDEDYELQAALQASMNHTPNTNVSSSHTPLIIPTVAFPPPNPNPSGFIPGHADVDPVTASIERNRVLLQRFTEQQEFAQRELWDDDDGRTRRDQRRRQEEEEEEMLRRAIEESEAMARQHHPETLTEDTGGGAGRSAPAVTSNGYTRAFDQEHIVYDDEDAELQAALRASLEHMPADWKPPPPKPVPAPVPSHFVPPPPPAVPGTSNGPVSQPKEVKVNEDEYTDDGDSVMTDDTEHASPIQPEPEPAPSIEEIRRRRLARFGG